MAVWYPEVRVSEFRLGRALLRRNVRLAILDEPFRGIDREKRRLLLRTARERWQDTTLLCITHDVSETLAFQRVVVIENGRIIEQGSPQILASDPTSSYHHLLDAEKAVGESMWASAEWRRLVIDNGRLSSAETGTAEVDLRPSLDREN